LVALEGSQLADIVKDSEGKRLDTRRRRVLLGVAAELAVQTEIG
jgi:hypothetical protein